MREIGRAAHRKVPENVEKGEGVHCKASLLHEAQDYDTCQDEEDAEACKAHVGVDYLRVLCRHMHHQPAKLCGPEKPAVRVSQYVQDTGKVTLLPMQLQGNSIGNAVRSQRAMVNHFTGYISRVVWMSFR